MRSIFIAPLLLVDEPEICKVSEAIVIVPALVPSSTVDTEEVTVTVPPIPFSALPPVAVK